MLQEVFTRGYDAARSLAFYNRPVVQAIFWLRLPGDLLVILGSAVFAYDVLKKRVVRREEPAREPEGTAIARRLFDDETGHEPDD